MTWWPALLGWPAIALSAILVAAGFMRSNEYLVLAAVLPIIPIGYYIFGSPVYWWLPVAVILALLYATWTIRRDRRAGERD